MRGKRTELNNRKPMGRAIVEELFLSAIQTGYQVQLSFVDRVSAFPLLLIERQ